MSKARTALQSGELDRCLEELKNEVRAAPSDPEKRVFLFQLYSLLGELDKALTQLNVCRDLDPKNVEMAQTYQEVLRCEGLRAAVFRGERTPLVLGEPPAWIGMLLEALRHLAQNDLASFSRLQQEAFEAAETSSGTLYPFSTGAGDDAAEEGQAFEWIADADMRMGPVVEAIVNGRYYWIPFSNIKTIVFEKPVDLRDLVWTPVAFEWTNDGQAVGFIPTRYPQSHANDDDQIRLARMTSWDSPGEEIFLGQGQRVFATDVQDFPITGIRRLVLNPPQSTGA